MLFKKLGIFIIVSIIFSTLFVFVNPELRWAFVDRYVGESDAMIYLWLVSVIPRYIWTSFYDLPFFFPATKTLAFSDNYLLPAMLGAFIRWCSGSDVLAFNLPILLAVGANGVVTFICMRWLTGHINASLVSAILFMFCPLLNNDFAHPQLQFAFFMPAAIYSSLRYIKDKDLPWGASIGGVIVGAFFCSVYYAYFCILLVGVIFALALIRRSLSVFELIRICLLNSPWILLLGIFGYPYYEVSLIEGTRKLRDIEGLRVDYVTNWLGLPTKGAVKVYVISLFFWLLTLVTLFKSWRSKQQIQFHIWLLLFIIVTSVFLSLGRIGSVGPNLFNPALFVILYKLIPGFSALRGAFRFLTVAYLGFSLIAGFLVWRLTRSRLNIWVSRLVASMLMTFSMYLALSNNPIPTMEVEQISRDSVYFKLSEIKGEGAVISLPFPHFSHNEHNYAYHHLGAMLRLRQSNKSIVNGYSGVNPRFHKDLGYKLRDFPEASSVQALKDIKGLRFVILESKSLVERLEGHPSDDLIIIYKDSEGRALIKLRS